MAIKHLQLILNKILAFAIFITTLMTGKQLQQLTDASNVYVILWNRKCSGEMEIIDVTGEQQHKKWGTS